MKMNKQIMILGTCAVMSLTTGCWRPYGTPDVQTVENNETAFFVPMEGSKDAQVKFESVEQLNQMKVATKRVVIPMTRIKTGRWRNSGRWYPTHRLIKVDRTPVAKRWTAEGSTGTAKGDQSLQAESKDSIGVSSGFSITAYVKAEDAATYLFWFLGKDLGAVVDSQIFNFCQAVYSEQCSKWEVKELRLYKEQISEAIRAKVIPEFATYGITINPSLGLIGGLMYDNAKIQEAIDTVFIAQTSDASSMKVSFNSRAINKASVSPTFLPFAASATSPSAYALLAIAISSFSFICFLSVVVYILLSP